MFWALWRRSPCSAQNIVFFGFFGFFNVFLVFGQICMDFLVFLVFPWFSPDSAQDRQPVIQTAAQPAQHNKRANGSFGLVWSQSGSPPALQALPRNTKETLQWNTFLDSRIHSSTVKYIPLQQNIFLYSKIHSSTAEYIPLQWNTLFYSKIHSTRVSYIPLQ